jgi:hypothetical protein
MYSLNPEIDGRVQPNSRVALFEKFEKRPALKAVLDTFTASVAAAELVAAAIANTSFQLLGTNAVTATPTFNAEGGLNLLTQGGATDSSILVPHLTTNLSPWTSITWGSDRETHWGCEFKTAAALTNTTIWCGLKLTNTPTVATDDDQVIFKYVNGTDTNWQCTYSIGGVDVTTDSGTDGVVSAATVYRLAIKIDASRIARFFVNDKLVVTSTALTDTKDFIPYIGVLSAVDATAKSIVVRNCWISRNQG